MSEHGHPSAGCEPEIPRPGTESPRTEDRVTGVGNYDESLGWTVGPKCLERGNNRFIWQVSNIIVEFAAGLRIRRVYLMDEFLCLGVRNVPPDVSTAHILGELKAMDPSQPSDLYEHARILREKDEDSQRHRLILTFEYPAFAKSRIWPRPQLNKLLNRHIRMPSTESTTSMAKIISDFPEPTFASHCRSSGKTIRIACKIFTECVDIFSSNRNDLEAFHNDLELTGTPKTYDEDDLIEEIVDDDVTVPKWGARVWLRAGSMPQFERELREHAKIWSKVVPMEGKWTADQVTQAIKSSPAFHGFDTEFTGYDLDDKGNYRADIEFDDAAAALSAMQTLNIADGVFNFALEDSDTDPWRQEVTGLVGIWHRVHIKVHNGLACDMRSRTINVLEEWTGRKKVNIWKRGNVLGIGGFDRDKVAYGASLLEFSIRGHWVSGSETFIDGVELYLGDQRTSVPGQTQHFFNDQPVPVRVDEITHRLYYLGECPNWRDWCEAYFPIDQLDPHQKSIFAKRFSPLISREPDPPPRQVWAAARGPSHECLVCFGETSNPHVASCGHVYCTECFVQVCQKAEINNSTGVFEIHCWATADGGGMCHTPFLNEEIEAALKGRIFHKLIGKVFRSFFDRHQAEFRYCHMRDCIGIHRAASDLPQNSWGTCPQCISLFCYKCHEIHGPGGCVSPVDPATRQLMESEGIKACPRCSTLMQKTDGCNHMTCERCRADICWVCLALFDGPDGANHCADHLRREHGSMYDDELSDEEGEVDFGIYFGEDLELVDNDSADDSSDDDGDITMTETGEAFMQLEVVDRLALGEPLNGPVQSASTAEEPPTGED